MRILLILLFSFKAFASVDHNDFNFEVKLIPSGKLEVKMKSQRDFCMLFEKETKFSEIISNLYLNETLKQDLDEDFISQEVEFNGTSDDGQSKGYTLDMKVKRSGVTATLNNKLNCTVLENKRRKYTMNLKGQTI